MYSFHVLVSVLQTYNILSKDYMCIFFVYTFQKFSFNAFNSFLFLQYIEDWYDGKKAKSLYDYSYPFFYERETLYVPLDVVTDGITLANYAESSVVPILGKIMILRPHLRNRVEGLVLIGLVPVVKIKNTGHKPGGPIGACLNSFVRNEENVLRI